MKMVVMKRCARCNNYEDCSGFRVDEKNRLVCQNCDQKLFSETAAADETDGRKVANEMMQKHIQRVARNNAVAVFLFVSAAVIVASFVAGVVATLCVTGGPR